MKIGIMLRHYNQHGGGVWVYTRNLLREMLALDTPHEFVLLYQDPRLVGTYSSNGGRVREVAIEVPSIFLWDQLAVWWAEKKEKLDLIFNPKYSLPLMAKCRRVFVCHGLDWYVMPWGSKWIDRLNHNYLIPRYARKADAIIAVSNITRQHVVEYLGVDEDRVHTVYHGINEAFRKPISEEELEKARQTYRLPERFFLYVGQIYPPKNFGRLLHAYARAGPNLGISLVVAGEHRWLCGEELALINRLSLSQWVIQTGWIDHDTLPAFYALAEALLLPSLYESFGIPLIEAMSSGCPVVTANRYATRELAEEVGVLVDPEDVDSIAEGMHCVVTDHSLRQRLIKAGRKRSYEFSWKKCAEETLKVLENVLAQA
jgi:glycosyltransferase involved in cell wall biosynthesis